MTDAPSQARPPPKYTTALLVSRVSEREFRAVRVGAHTPDSLTHVVRSTGWLLGRHLLVPSRHSQDTRSISAGILGCGRVQGSIQWIELCCCRQRSRGWVGSLPSRQREDFTDEAPLVLGSHPYHLTLPAAIFFSTYESLKPVFSSSSSPLSPALSHMLAASLAETAACLIRVPTEVIKSRMQAGTYKGQAIGTRADGTIGLVDIVKTIIAREGMRGFWKGFGTTVAREVSRKEVKATSRHVHDAHVFLSRFVQIPFTCIQFPLYERLKLVLLQRHNAGLPKSAAAKSLPTYQAALVGSFAGGLSAAVTTPLDVVKTRLMLVERAAASQGSAAAAQAAGADAAAMALGVNQKFLPTLVHISKTQGAKGLFKGVVPRTIWISLGGAVFLGSFELGVKAMEG